MRDCRDSVVIVTFTGRDGNREGLGTGFLVGDTGLVATNLHVLGEARPIQVRTKAGRAFEVRAVEASDRAMDLALLRIDGDLGQKGLPLGDSDALAEGQSVVAIGNPLGLTHSVVAGVVSGKREIDGKPMIQLAMPIEQGNSGGPLLDLHGRVVGILTMKSLVSENLGFAVQGNVLRGLLDRPNPIPMSRWLTIGALDPTDWTPLFGANWRQRAGRIVVDGLGSGFGGRSICLSSAKVPEPPFELAVRVRLDNESGAAGLAFASDGEHRHYGFYPSNGRLRLTQFHGPDVFSWRVIREVASPHYRAGEWNTLKVRFEPERILCHVNGEMVIESAEVPWREGRVGLAKFRDTQAQFREFRVATQVADDRADARVIEQVAKAKRALEADPGAIDAWTRSLSEDSAESTRLLREEARQLELQSRRLRELAGRVHRQRVIADLAAQFNKVEPAIDLVTASLQVARLDNDEVDVGAYRREVDRMGAELAKQVDPKGDPADKLKALRRFLFEELGFHGSRGDYYNRSNSYLNEVLDDREGLPITLSILYMDLARQLGVETVGVGLPGHFVVKWVANDGSDTLIDVFDGGVELTTEMASARIEEATGRPPIPEDLAPMGKKSILVRVLRNLLGIARRDEDVKRMLGYLDAILALDPESHADRWIRAVVRLELNDREGARDDADWLTRHHPDDVDLRQVEQLMRLLDAPGPGGQ